MYALRTILALIDDYRQQKPLKIDAEWPAAIADMLSRPLHDTFLMSEMLILPSENYIGEQMQVVDVEAIHAVREFVLDQLAKELEPVFHKIYQHCHETTGKYEFNMKEVGRRQLKNRVLAYLARLPKGIDLAVTQFDISYQTNMTDTAAALSCLANSNTPARIRVLQQFYDTWKNDALVVDKWFAVQALSSLPDTLTEIKALTRHPAFDIKNPNKVFALICAFAYRNPAIFHAANGEGYVFLREMVQQLDKLNPLVAARTVKPLTTWNRYDKERQRLMQEQLQLILKDKTISNDMYELVTKSLQQEG